MIDFSQPDLPYKLNLDETELSSTIGIEVLGQTTPLLTIDMTAEFCGARAVVTAFAVDAVCQLLNAGESIDCIRKLCDVVERIRVTHDFDPIYFYATSNDSMLVLGNESQQMFYVYVNGCCVEVLDPTQYAEWYSDHAALVESYDDIFSDL